MGATGASGSGIRRARIREEQVFGNWMFPLPQIGHSDKMLSLEIAPFLALIFFR